MWAIEKDFEKKVIKSIKAQSKTPSSMPFYIYSSIDQIEPNANNTTTTYILSFSRELLDPNNNLIYK